MENVKGFIIIGDGSNESRTERNPENPWTYIQLAPIYYKISVGITNNGNYSGPYWDYYKKGWYQGSWSIKIPIENLPSSEFIKLMTKVQKAIFGMYPKDDDHSPVFYGKTYSSLYPQMETCMKQIIAILKSESGRDDWNYEENAYGTSIKNKLELADKYVEDWQANQLKKKIDELRNFNTMYKDLRNHGATQKEAMMITKKNI